MWTAAKAKAGEERALLQRMVDSEGGNFQIEAWDWRHYAEKVRKAEYDLDEAEIKPYLQLDRMIEAAFDTATRLFGVTFAERTDLPKYQEDVRTWEVKHADGRHLGVFVGDYFARPSKRSGAWMSAFRGQQRLRGDIHPVIVNVLNFARGADGEPTLLSFTDARTLFHEFGHALHGLLSDVTYPSIAGTAVSTDFVELPSQLYEHWLEEPDVLKRFARHHTTGEPIPDALLDRLKAANTFNQGFATVEYVSSALADMELHALASFDGFDLSRFEADMLKRIGHAARNRHAPPPAALRAYLLRRRLCGRLLQLHVVGGHGRRCLRRLRGDRQRLRSGDREEARRVHLLRRQPPRSRRGLHRLPRPPADARRDDAESGVGVED